MSDPECCGGSLSWQTETHASWCPGYVNDLEFRLEVAEAGIVELQELLQQVYRAVRLGHARLDETVGELIYGPRTDGGYS